MYNTTSLLRRQSNYVGIDSSAHLVLAANSSEFEKFRFIDSVNSWPFTMKKKCWQNTYTPLSIRSGKEKFCQSS